MPKSRPVSRSSRVTSPSANDLQLPHERDESPRSETPGQRGPRGRVRQAAVDVERGLIDTEARGTPSNVPNSSTRKPRSA